MKTFVQGKTEVEVHSTEFEVFFQYIPDLEDGGDLDLTGIYISSDANDTDLTEMLSDETIETFEELVFGCIQNGEYESLS